VQFLHFAERIEVASTFYEAGQTFIRRFFCNPKTYITDPSVAPASPSAPIGTTIAMNGFLLGKEAKALFDNLSLTELRNAIKSHFLLRLYLAKAANKQLASSFRFEFHKNGKLADSTTLGPDDIPTPETGDIKVHYVKAKDVKADAIEWVTQLRHVEQLHWAHFKLGADEIAENGVVLCSKETEVDRLRVEGLKKSEAVDGHRFLTAIHGSVLDKPGNVSHAVDRFTFPSRSDTERAAREDLFFEPERELLSSKISSRPSRMRCLESTQTSMPARRSSTRTSRRSQGRTASPLTSLIDQDQLLGHRGADHGEDIQAAGRVPRPPEPQDQEAVRRA
jgi:hypothetical protein